MNIEIVDEKEEGIDPLICDICKEEIGVGDKFIEIRTNNGIKRRTAGYVKGIEPIYWDTEQGQIHLKHTLYAQVSD